MAEQSCGAFFDSPTGAIRPKSGEFVMAKSGADADASIVAGDAIAADDAEKRSGEGRPGTTARFAGNEKVTTACREGEHLLQGGGFKMMQKEVRDDGRPASAGPAQPFDNVRHYDVHGNFEAPELRDGGFI